MNTYRILVVIGSMMLVVGARLPWMSVPILYGVEGHVYEAIEIGWEDNGFVTGGIGLVLLLGVYCVRTRQARGIRSSAYSWQELHTWWSSGVSIAY